MFAAFQKFIGILLLITGIIACNQVNKMADGKLDLLKYGIPVTLQAPDDVEISKVGKGTLAHVSVKNEQGYDVQVFMAEAVSQDMTWLKQQKKEMVTAHPNFTKIVEEYDNGFIYEKTENDGSRSYDYIIIELLGDKEITFMGGNTGTFSEENVKTMVQSIK